MSLGASMKALQARVDHGVQGHGLEIEQLIAGFDASQAEQVENEAMQSVALLGNPLEEGATMLRIVDRSIEECFNAGLDDGQGSFQLVGGVGHEVATEAFEPAQLSSILNDDDGAARQGPRQAGRVDG